MINERFAAIIALELNIASAFVRNTIKLLEEGATIPFIARYRKEMTGTMDEVVIARVRDRLNQLKELDARRTTIIKSLTEQESLRMNCKKQWTMPPHWQNSKTSTFPTSQNEEPGPA